MGTKINDWLQLSTEAWQRIREFDSKNKKEPYIPAGGAKGFGPETCELYAPYIENMQTEQFWGLEQSIPVKPAEGAILILHRKIQAA